MCRGQKDRRLTARLIEVINDFWSQFQSSSNRFTFRKQENSTCKYCSVIPSYRVANRNNLSPNWVKENEEFETPFISGSGWHKLNKHSPPYEEGGTTTRQGNGEIGFGPAPPVLPRQTDTLIAGLKTPPVPLPPPPPPCHALITAF